MIANCADGQIIDLCEGRTPAKENLKKGSSKKILILIQRLDCKPVVNLLYPRHKGSRLN